MIIVAPPSARRKAGRPVLPEADKRHHVVMVRLSDAEVALLDERRGNLQRGSWLRAAALEAVPPKPSGLDVEALRSLSHLSNTITQIAHRMNAQGGFDVSDRQAVNSTAEVIGQIRQDILGISPS